jgi:hypothetical protein
MANRTSYVASSRYHRQADKHVAIESFNESDLLCDATSKYLIVLQQWSPTGIPRGRLLVVFPRNIE